MHAQPIPSKPTPAPHKLKLYELAVQRPWVSVNLLMNLYASFNPGQWARRLREDFAGSACLARTWASHDHDHHATAIDMHAPTLRHACKQAKKLPADVQQRLTFHHADVLAIAGARADLIAAFNFSINIYHQRDALRAYLRHTRKQLAPGGVWVGDVYGGPGAWCVGIQKRKIKPDRQENIAPFTYEWEQRSADALTGRVNNRIHFTLADGRRIQNAFVYDWRLWTLPELTDLLSEAGFDRVEVWSDDDDQGWGPVQQIDAGQTFLAYVAAWRNR